MSVLTVALCFVVAAAVVTVAAGMGKAPLWVAVLLLCVAELVHVLPLA